MHGTAAVFRSIWTRRPPLPRGVAAGGTAGRTGAAQLVALPLAKRSPGICASRRDRSIDRHRGTGAGSRALSSRFRGPDGREGEWLAAGRARLERPDTGSRRADPRAGVRDRIDRRPGMPVRRDPRHRVPGATTRGLGRPWPVAATDLANRFGADAAIWLEAGMNSRGIAWRSTASTSWSRSKPSMHTRETASPPCRSARAPDSVDVVLGHRRKLEVDAWGRPSMSRPRAATRSRRDVDAAFLEVIERLDALALGLVAVNRAGRDPVRDRAARRAGSRRAWCA